MTQIEAGLTAPADIYRKFEALRQRNSERDMKMWRVRKIREGNWREVAPGMFPDAGVESEPQIANFIDGAARDFADEAGPLPTVSCVSGRMITDAEHSRATKRTMIAAGYQTISNLQVQAYTGVDRYASYGFLPGRVELDFERKMPVIRLLDPTGCYPTFDRFEQCTGLFQELLHDVGELAELYPEFAGQLLYPAGVFQSAPATGNIRVIHHHDKNHDMFFVPDRANMVLSNVPNPIGKCLVVVARQPGAVGAKGSYDDAVFVQLAKQRWSALRMQAAEKSVKAPLVVPEDVTVLPLGANSVIRVRGGVSQVGHVQLPIPQSMFQEAAAQDKELQQATRTPEIRNGNTDASIITGRGVQELMSGFKSQIRTAQSVFARFLSDLFSLAFEVDAKVWPAEKKNLRATLEGAPFSLDYVPGKDIGTDYTVDVTYGMMAGLDPNRALVYTLQAMSADLISKDTARRSMPGQLNVVAEETKIELEKMRDNLGAAIAASTQAIPSMIAQGQDPTELIQKISAMIEGRKQGKSIEVLANLIFASKKEESFDPPGSQEPGEPAGTVPAGTPEGAPQDMGAGPGAGMPGMGGGPPPDMSGGMPGQGFQPRPDMATLVAGLTGSGKPTLAANVKRQRLI